MREELLFKFGGVGVQVDVLFGGVQQATTIPCLERHSSPLGGDRIFGDFSLHQSFKRLKMN